MDTSLFFLIHRDWSAIWLDAPMVWISRWWFVPVIGLLAAQVPRDRRNVFFAGVVALVALGVADGTGGLIKGIVARDRPCLTLEGVRVLMGCGKSGSFPSNHAAGAFAVAGAVLAGTRSPLRFGTVLIALLVGWSRVYVGAHYPTDVIGGALLGLGLAFVTARLIGPFLGRAYDRNPDRVILGAGLFFVTVFRLVYVAQGPLDLAGDEAHYWEWSRHLDLSYYSKGPFVAYWIRLFTTLLGTSEVAVRAGAAVLSVFTSLLLFDLGRRLYGSERIGLWAAALYQVTPAFFVYGVVMTIDPPFFFFWTLGFWVFVLLVREKEGIWWAWVTLGLVFGFGLLAKYTMGLFAGCVGVALMLDPGRRRLLLKPQPYAAFILALLVFSPVVLWNAQHDWVTFRHTAGQVALDEGMALSLETAGNFIGAQFGIIGPLLLPALLWSSRQDRDDDRRRLISVFSLPVLGFFLLKSFQAKVQGNWALPGYIPLFLPLAALAVDRFRRGSRWFVRAAAGLSLVMTLCMLSPDTIHRLGFRIAGQDKMIGWAELGKTVGELRDEMPRPEKTFIASDYYMVASELAFYVPGRPTTYGVGLGERRMNQYDLWPGPGQENAGWDGLFVIMGRSPVPSAVQSAFEKVDPLEVEVGTGKVQRRFTVVRGYGFRGFPSAEVRSY